MLVAILVIAAAPPRTAAPSTAKPNPPPASAEAQDFIRSRCDTTCRLRPEAAAECAKALLPHAASINGSYIRADATAATAMVSQLAAFAKELRDGGDSQLTGGCVRMAEEALTGARKPLAKLWRLAAVGDEKMGEHDLHGVAVWLDALKKSFQLECHDGALKKMEEDHPIMPRAAVVENAIYASVNLVYYPTPYSLKFIASPL
ncbi:unnamed protein product [Urochloa decumbens]|uniref:Pectinesterase inhibitor domain-containing protein n=1 Tax=Urochloa decumbens TaxID=240449 RepID=A0ABC9GDP3_9POAL